MKYVFWYGFCFVLQIGLVKKTWWLKSCMQKYMTNNLGIKNSWELSSDLLMETVIYIKAIHE